VYSFYKCYVIIGFEATLFMPR